MTTPLLPTTTPGATPVRVMTIAGSDSGGGAGIQADMRTFALLGLHGLVAVTAVTVQNSTGVSGFQEIDPDIVAAQIRSVVTDIGTGAAKTGMLASGRIIDAVVDTCTELGIGRDGTSPLVVDPVCASMHGDQLLADDALDVLRRRLFPLATVVTPNLDEVRLLTGVDVVDAESQRKAAVELHGLGPQWVLVKGGHLRSSASSPDLLYDGTDFVEFASARVDTPHDHGAGDTLAAGIACALAHGFTVPAAIDFAKQWVTRGLRSAYPLGSGHGPVNPLWRVGPDEQDARAASTSTVTGDVAEQ
ncbi:bifunctional hydroxymethylpyrimidine kinase/phosphomethylpyrimidine kinase [Gordonia aichiensis]|uniref:Phosphomethylpyrimidine kinase n=1 Tax=Gordonia aichiensis NBRC 108223 TaxID=1220583 RepID=L7KH13_9ACTN|nr:bifunctional hydroxymethylpyrimidine kinase/phosphomethylpyrimidine kinase [Gordonia aichiensis]GAC47786.1 phosphomethylpyrimidine kinase [Gordonia aichiensis NBRC 108223]